jgi:CO/xanthine dehydrogenase FAD-binding subunit
MIQHQRAAIPSSISDATAILAHRPDLRVVCGGTDVMVGVNEGSTPVSGWLSLRKIDELSYLNAARGLIGASVTFAQIEQQLHLTHRSLADAARTVGSPQIRSAGTIGGNIATASPAADSVPVLLCHDAHIELASVRGVRHVPLDGFAIGPKRTIREPDELITRVHLGTPGGVDSFAKVGTRNAMVISVCSLAARLDPQRMFARVAIGSVAPTVLRAHAAESFLLDPHSAEEFAAQVVAAAAPIDDTRATAAYRRQALRVLALRTHKKLWAMHRAEVVQ